MLKKHLKSILTKFFPRFFPAYKNPFLFLSRLPITAIIDVGANIGQFAHEIRQVFPLLPLHSCEPIKENFDELQKSFIKDSNFNAYHIGCGEKQEQKEIHINTYSPSSSLLHTTELHDQSFGHTGESGRKEVVTIDTLDHFVIDKSLGSEVLLKIDVQGYEDFVIKGGEQFIKNHVAAIIIEMSFVELYEGQAGFDVLHEKLVSMGFVYKGPLSIKKGSFGEPLFDDSCYIHKRHI